MYTWPLPASITKADLQALKCTPATKAPSVHLHKSCCNIASPMHFCTSPEPMRIIVTWLQTSCASMAQDISEVEERLVTAHTHLQQSQQSLEQKQERMEEIEAKSRDLYDTTVRLEAHIADLESRKRAPLYQKKQEEELKAAIEKAQECEIRAVDAEIKYKEAKVLSENQIVLRVCFQRHEWSWMHAAMIAPHCCIACVWHSSEHSVVRLTKL